MFAARETADTLRRSLQAAIAACGTTPTDIAVLVNGNEALAQEAVGVIDGLDARPAGCRIRLFSIAPGDKAHAWNVYMHQIAIDAELCFFIDGYVQVWPNALRLLADALAAQPQARAATGVPTIGRSAAALRREMLASGGLHGNLYVFPRAAMQTLQGCGFQLPVGLYRNDSLLGALCCFNLDPAGSAWDVQRILVHPKVSWGLQENHVSALAWLGGQLKRRLRQAQGELENVAFREHFSVRKLAPETLPATVNALVCDWIAANPGSASLVFRRYPLTRLAYRKLLHTPAPDLAAQRLVLLASRVTA